MPNPPAAFSPLTMTKSSRHRARKIGNWARSTLRPDRPTTSPTNSSRIASGAPAIDQFALGQHEVETLIVRFVGNISLGGGIGDSDRRHGAGGAQRGERAVGMARAEAEPM